MIGDSEGHIGLGIKTSKEVATAIRAAIIIAKLSVVPIRRGYWGTNLGEPHSLPTKQSGKCGSVTVRVCRHSTNLQAKCPDSRKNYSPPNAPLDMSRSPNAFPTKLIYICRSISMNLRC